MGIIDQAVGSADLGQSGPPCRGVRPTHMSAALLAEKFLNAALEITTFLRVLSPPFVVVTVPLAGWVGLVNGWLGQV